MSAREKLDAFDRDWEMCREALKQGRGSLQMLSVRALDGTHYQYNLPADVVERVRQRLDPIAAEARADLLARAKEEARALLAEDMPRCTCGKNALASGAADAPHLDSCELMKVRAFNTVTR